MARACGGVGDPALQKTPSPFAYGSAVVDFDQAYARGVSEGQKGSEWGCPDLTDSGLATGPVPVKIKGVDEYREK
jgi:hypothetical protein